MIAFGSIALLRPWWLALLPLLVLLIWLARPRRFGLADWERAVDTALLDAMLRRGGANVARRFGAVAWALGLMLLALSGPALRRSDADRFRNLDAALLVLDLSGDATRGGELQQAVTAAQRVVDGAGARQIGLVLYAGDAY